MKKIPIAVQLYSIREACAADFPGTLKKVAQMGYDGVEFAGYHNRSAREVKAMLDDNGLKCAGTHLSADALLKDLDATVEFNKTIGNKFLVMTSIPAAMHASAEAMKAGAKTISEIAAKVKKHGMAIAYHNHAAEFKKMDGKYAWDVFFSTASKDLVIQVDTGNARVAGVDPLPYIKRYAGQAKTVHLKEWTDDPKGSLVGEGKIPWKEFFKLCESVGGTEWYIVEQETYPIPPMEAVAKCLKNLRAMGK